MQRGERRAFDAEDARRAVRGRGRARCSCSSGARPSARRPNSTPARSAATCSRLAQAYNTLLPGRPDPPRRGPEVRTSRLLLSAAVRAVLVRGCELLGHRHGRQDVRSRSGRAYAPRLRAPPPRRRRLPLSRDLHVRRARACRRHAALAAVPGRPDGPAAASEERAPERLAACSSIRGSTSCATRGARGGLRSGTSSSGCGEPLLANSPVRSALALPPHRCSSPATRRPTGGSSRSSWSRRGSVCCSRPISGSPPPRAPSSALAYGFSSFMQIWALHPHSASASFAPGILWALLRLDGRAVRLEVPRRGRLRRVLGPRRPRGDRREVRALRRRRRPPARHHPGARGRARPRRRSRGIGGAHAGVLLAACVLVPFFDYVSQSDVADARSLYAGAETLPRPSSRRCSTRTGSGPPLNPPTWHGVGPLSRRRRPRRGRARSASPPSDCSPGSSGGRRSRSRSSPRSAPR